MGKQARDRVILILETTIEILGLALLAFSIMRNNHNTKKGTKR